jgi:hypothetical protein
MKQIFFKLSVCTYSACFIISKCITCISIFPTKIMKVTRKKKIPFYSKGRWNLSKLAAGFIGMTMFLEGAADKITWIWNSSKSMLFWEFHCGDVNLYSVLSIMISTRKHFKALDFKIMPLENSMHMGFQNISWTYFCPPGNYSYGKNCFCM